MSLLLLLPLALQLPVAPQPASFPPRIVWAELPAELPRALRDSVRFGYLEVPEDHAEPDGRRIRIALALLPADPARRVPDPVVSIAGGPGLPAISLHMGVRAEGRHPLDVHRDRRDLIIIDPRGHGFSMPASCPELRGVEPLVEESPAAERLWLAKLAHCRDYLRAQGVRLETLSAEQAAHDLEWLRRALGAPRLNVIGLSYGTRIAAEALRQVPASIRAVHFSGPVPAGLFGEVDRTDVADEVLGALFGRCASRPPCRAAFPHLQADHDSIMRRLHRNPVAIAIPRSHAAPEGVVMLDDRIMRDGLAQLLLDRRLAAGVPLLVYTLAAEGMGPLERMAPRLIRELNDASVAPETFLSFWCNDGVVSHASTELLRRRCRIWLGAAWDGARAAPVRSDVPALIETGELDPRTPPSYARFLAAGMPRARVVIVPWYGHERPPECSLRIARAFFDAPEQQPAQACLDSIPPIDFVTGVVPSRWVGNAVGRVATRPWLATLPALAALLLIVPVVAIPRRRRVARPRGLSADGAAPLALWLVAALGLLLLAGFAVALAVAARRHFFIPVIGLTGQWAWLLVLPWLLLGLTPAAAVLALRPAARLEGTMPAGLRVSALLGAALLLALWLACRLA